MVEGELKFMVTKKNDIFLYEGDKKPFDKLSNNPFLNISLSQFSDKPFAQIRQYSKERGMVFQLLDGKNCHIFSKENLLRFIELMDYLEKEVKKTR